MMARSQNYVAQRDKSAKKSKMKKTQGFHVIAEAMHSSGAEEKTVVRKSFGLIKDGSIQPFLSIINADRADNEFSYSAKKWESRLEKAKSLLPLITFVLSLLVFVLSGLKVAFYSKYFGIPVSEFEGLTELYTMFCISLPIWLFVSFLLCIIYFSKVNSYSGSSNAIRSRFFDVVKYVGFEMFVLYMLLTVFEHYFESVFRFLLYDALPRFIPPISVGFDAATLSVCIFCFGWFFLSVLLHYLPRFIRWPKIRTIEIIVNLLLIISLSLFCLFDVYNRLFSEIFPHFKHEFEVTEIEGIDPDEKIYVAIANTDNGKLVVNGRLEGDDLVIDKNSYTFIDSKEYLFEIRHIDNVSFENISDET